MTRMIHLRREPLKFAAAQHRLEPPHWRSISVTPDKNKGGKLLFEYRTQVVEFIEKMPDVVACAPFPVRM